MATTPGGLPYPVGTDFVVNGDDAMGALAKATDARKASIIVKDNQGTAMPAGAVPMILAFPAQDNTDASGRLHITFTPPFATPPILTVLVVSGATTSPVVDGAAVNAGDAYVIWPGFGSHTVRVAVIAIGWVLTMP